MRDGTSRLIPAHAGKTQLPPIVARSLAAHPRSRGENLFPITPLRLTEGSSPLTRGKLDRLSRNALHLGLIPAHAGKTATNLAKAAQAAAHPRSRGENGHGGHGGWSFQGSSPLTRGKPRRTNVHTVPGRLIPAHAGKTWSRPSTRTVAWAHPRSRGENAHTWSTYSSEYGSSPLTRGKHDGIHSLLVHDRLIPAHAGKTRRWKRKLVPTPAHPRSRGENVDGRGLLGSNEGSSPLTRGKPV